MKSIQVKKALAVAVVGLLLTVSGYAQSLEKGEVEGTGQVGIVTGIEHPRVICRKLRQVGHRQCICAW